MFCTGTIEEKIYQRQTSKEQLSSVVIDAKNTNSKFSKEYLKEIFTYTKNCLSFNESDNTDSDLFKGSFLDKVGDIVDIVKMTQAD